MARDYMSSAGFIGFTDSLAFQTKEIADQLDGFDVTPKGPFLFSFDGETVYNFWSDWDSFTDEQKRIFREDNPIMAALKEPT